MKISLRELARQVGGRLSGRGDRMVEGLNEQGCCSEDRLCLVGTVEAARAFGDVPGLAALVVPGFERVDWDCIVVEDFRPAMAALLSFFAPPDFIRRGVHPTAVVHPDAVLALDCYVGPYCVIEEGACVGSGVQLIAHVYLGRQTTVGEQSVLHPFVVLEDRCRVGARCILHSHVTLGADGFGFVPGGSGGKNVKVPQIGGLMLGDDVEIGASSCVDRGALGDTVIGSGTKLDNLVQIGHGSRLGENCLLASQSGVAGSSILGAGTILAAKAGVKDHITLGRDVLVYSKAGVTKSQPDGAQISGFPAQSHGEETKLQASLRRLPDALKRLKDLEKEVRLCVEALKDR